MKVLIIDGSSVAFKAFVMLPPLMNRNKERVEVVYNFIYVLRKFVKECVPDVVIVVWEGDNSLRVKDCFEYKKHRRESKEREGFDYKSYLKQIKLLNYWLPLLGINSISEEGYEADDVIVVLSKKFRDKNFDVIVVSDDSDLLYVNIFGVCLYNTKGKKLVNLNKKDFSVDFENVFFYKAIVGDRSDGVSGVVGLGDSFWKSISDSLIGLSGKEKMIFLFDKIKDKKGDKGLEQFLKSYELVRLPYKDNWDLVNGYKFKRFKTDKEFVVNFLYEFDIKSIKVDNFWF